MEFATFSQVNSPAFQVQEADVLVFSLSYLLMGAWIEICRGSHEDDVHTSHYVIADAITLEDCKMQCIFPLHVQRHCLLKWEL